MWSSENRDNDKVESPGGLDGASVGLVFVLEADVGVADEDEDQDEEEDQDAVRDTARWASAPRAEFF